MPVRCAQGPVDVGPDVLGQLDPLCRRSPGNQRGAIWSLPQRLPDLRQRRCDSLARGCGRAPRPHRDFQPLLARTISVRGEIREDLHGASREPLDTCSTSDDPGWTEKTNLAPRFIQPRRLVSLGLRGRVDWLTDPRLNWRRLGTVLEAIQLCVDCCRVHIREVERDGPTIGQRRLGRLRIHYIEDPRRGTLSLRGHHPEGSSEFGCDIGDLTPDVTHEEPH